MILLDEHQNVVDIDLDLFDELDLKDNIVRDVLFFATGLTVFPFVPQILIAAKIILKIPLAQNFASGKLVERSQQVAHTKNRTEQNDKLLLPLFAGNTFLCQREFRCQFLNHILVAWVIFSVGILVAKVVILIATHQDDTARFLIAKQRNCIVGALLQIAEANDVAEHLDGIENPVGAGICLNQPVHFQVFIHPQRIQRRGVEAGQEHIDHDQQVKFLVLHPQGNILIVILEFVPVCGIVGVEHPVVVTDGRIQKITGTLVKCGGILRILLVKNTIRFFLIRSIAVNDGDLQPLLRIFRHLPLKLGVVELCSIHAGHGKDGVEPADPLLLLDFLDLLLAAGRGNLGDILQYAVCIGFITPVGLLVKMRQNVIRDQSNAFRGKKRFFPVDVPNLFVVNIRLGVHRFDVVHPEGQYIFVVNGVHNGIGVELIAKSLLCRAEYGILAYACIDCKDGRAGKAEQMVLLKVFGNGLMHIPELTPVALIKNDNNSLIKNAVSDVLLDKGGELLNGGDNDSCIVILQLALQNRRRGVAVGSSLFKAVIFPHRLIVQILAVHNEKHFVDVVQLGSKLRRLERGQCFAATGGVPDVPAACYGAVFLIIVGDLNAVQNALGGDDLIWPHHQQHIFRRKYTVTGKNIQNGVLAEKGLGKVHEIGDNAVVGVRPEGGEFKAIAGFGLLGFLRFGILDMIETGGIGIILRICAVGDHENLHKLVKPAGCPEAIPLIAVDLIEGFPNGNAPALQLDMDQRQTVDQHRHIIAVIVGSAFLGRDGILIDDLQAVVVYALLVNELDIFAFPVIPAEHLHIVLLNQPGLFENAGVCVCQHLVPETLPFAVRKAIVIQLFQLRPQIGNQVSLFMDGQALIAQLAK